MTVSNAFVAAIEEERSIAHEQLLLAATDTDRVSAIGRLADLDELLLRALDGVGERARSRALWGCIGTTVSGALGGKG